MSSFQAMELEYSGMKRSETIWEGRNVQVNESDLLIARENSHIFIYYQS